MDDNAGTGCRELLQAGSGAEAPQRPVTRMEVRYGV